MPTDRRRPESRRTERTMPPRRELPPPQRSIRLPGGYYDPDSATFDDVQPSAWDELLATTSPAEPLTLTSAARS